MAECDIFREQLAIRYPSHGHALWEPSPRFPDKPVQVGDVGFIRKGKFHRLFNVLLPESDRSHECGVPNDHEPLVPNIPDHLVRGSLACNNYCSAGVSVVHEIDHHSRSGDIPQVVYKYNRARGGAVLSLPVTARREDTLSQGDFKSWIVKNIDSWFAFAQKLGLGIERMEEIILVTGCDRAKSWANITFLGDQDDSQVAFGVRVENPDPSITFQFSPEKAQGAVLHHGPEGENLPENQCVFIRGYRVARTFWIFPRRLKAAAGPSTDPDGYDCDPDTEVISMPAISKYRDPLYILIDYIAEQASDCDMVLAHDDDLVNIDIDGLGHDSSLESLEPDVMMDLLRRSNMEIQKVPCVSADSDTNRDTSVVKVAMVLKKSRNSGHDIGPQSQGSLPALNIDLSCASESRVPGSFPVPTIRGHTSALETSLPADHGDGVLSTPQGLSRFKHATEYFDALATSIQRLWNSSPYSRHIVLALDKIRNEFPNIWSSISKFAHVLVERNALTIAVVLIGWTVLLLGWVFSFTWDVIFKIFTLFLASLPLYLLFEYRHRLRFDEKVRQCVESLQSNTAVPTRLDGRSFLIVGKETPANPGRFEQSMEDISGRGGRVSAAPNEDGERMRRDYEFCIATMQSHIASLEREIGDGDVRTRQLELSDQRIKQLEDSLDKFLRGAEEQSAAMLALQKELDNVKGLITEVSDLSRRNDELMTSKDSDLIVIRDLDAQLKDYRRKYEQAKTELRSVKATLFLQKPKFDDQLPVSADGAIPDVHLTAFLTAIDSLLSAGRSNAPTRVLTPMKSVVNAVTNILDDVRSHSRQYSDPEGVHALEDRVEAALSNIVAASKTHATSLGLSPVSLLDAAAGHVSAAVTELGRVVLLRRATKAEQEQFAPSSTGAATTGFTPGLRTVEEVRPSGTHQRGPSDSSRRSDQEREPLTHETSLDDWSSSAATIFDQRTTNAAGLTSSDSAAAKGSEDDWTELKPYLEAQTESIIYATQRVLSGVRSPTPSPTLNENLTQIVTIVSSIVAVCHDNLPASQARHGGDILRELSEHADKLSEMQALPEVTKESRQVMANSSFAIVNALKALQKL